MALGAANPSLLIALSAVIIPNNAAAIVSRPLAIPTPGIDARIFIAAAIASIDPAISIKVLALILVVHALRASLIPSRFLMTDEAFENTSPNLSSASFNEPVIALKRVTK